MITKHCKVGDVINSYHFRNLIRCRDTHGNQAYNKEDEKENDKIKFFVVNPYIEYEGQKPRLESDGIVSNVRGVEYNSSFENKKTNNFVVINTKYAGGGTGMGPHDIYPDAYEVRAKMLDDNGKWDENGITILFRQETTCYYNTVNEVDLFGTMTMSFK